MNFNLGPDLPVGCGLHAERVEHLYRTASPLLAYLNPWGGEFVLVIRSGHVLGIVRRDTRPVWQKLRDRMRLYFRHRFPKKATADPLPPEEPLAGCTA